MKCSVTVRCAHPGCKETGFYEFQSRREAADHAPDRRDWKCFRHESPDEILTLTNLEKLHVSENHFSKEADGNFWNGSRGIITGPGFKAYASDFPVGTKLIVTAKIILPQQPLILGVDL